MKIRNLKAEIDRLMSHVAGLQLRDGEEGAASAAPAAEKAPVVERASIGGAEAKFVKEFLKDDPDFAPKKEGVKEDAPADADGSDETDESDETTDETPDDKAPVDEKDDSKSEYEDNVLPGLTGKQLENLPDDVQAVIAKAHDKLEATSAAEAQLKALLSDPIVAHRAELKKKGQLVEKYDIPAPDAKTLEHLQTLIDEGTDSSMTKFKEEITGMMQTAAEAGAANARLAEQGKIQHQQMMSTAANNLLALSKLAKELNVKITDPAQILDTPFEDLGKLGEILSDLKDRKDKGLITSVARMLAETSPDEIYAMYAKKHGLALVINADEKLNKEKVAHGKEILNRFKVSKDKSSGRLPDSGEIDAHGSGSNHIRDGIDIIRLASDDAYHETIMNQKYSPQWIDKVAQLSAEGEKLLAENPKLATRLSSKKT